MWFKSPVHYLKTACFINVFHILNKIWNTIISKMQFLPAAYTDTVALSDFVISSWLDNILLKGVVLSIPTPLFGYWYIRLSIRGLSSYIKYRSSWIAFIYIMLYNSKALKSWKETMLIYCRWGSATNIILQTSIIDWTLIDLSIQQNKNMQQCFVSFLTNVCLLFSSQHVHY